LVSDDSNLVSKSKLQYKHLDTTEDTDYLYVFTRENNEPVVLPPEVAFAAADAASRISADVERFQKIQADIFTKIANWKSKFPEVSNIYLRANVVCPGIMKLLMIVIHDSPEHNEKLADSLAEFDCQISTGLLENWYFETYEAPEFLKNETLQCFMPDALNIDNGK